MAAAAIRRKAGAKGLAFAETAEAAGQQRSFRVRCRAGYGLLRQFNHDHGSRG